MTWKGSSISKLLVKYIQKFSQSVFASSELIVFLCIKIHVKSLLVMCALTTSYHI